MLMKPHCLVWITFTNERPQRQTAQATLWNWLPLKSKSCLSAWHSIWFYLFEDKTGTFILLRIICYYKYHNVAETGVSWGKVNRWHFKMVFGLCKKNNLFMLFHESQDNSAVLWLEDLRFTPWVPQSPCPWARNWTTHCPRSAQPLVCACVKVWMVTAFYWASSTIW